jgi:hypothetical protein
MFKIFVAVILIATGETAMLSSQASYPTKEACEAQIPVDTPKLQEELTKSYGEVKLKAECQKEDTI